MIWVDIFVLVFSFNYTFPSVRLLAPVTKSVIVLLVHSEYTLTHG